MAVDFVKALVQKLGNIVSDPGGQQLMVVNIVPDLMDKLMDKLMVAACKREMVAIDVEFEYPERQLEVLKKKVGSGVYYLPKESAEREQWSCIWRLSKTVEDEHDSIIAILMLRISNAGIKGIKRSLYDNWAISRMRRIFVLREMIIGVDRLMFNNRLFLEEFEERPRYHRMDFLAENGIGLEDNEVGFEDGVNQVIQRLTGNSEHLEIVSIVGELELGKITLAKKVFNDTVIQAEFFPRAFVYVSQGYNVRDVFINILSSFTPITNKMLEMTEEELATCVRKQLDDRKYLIIMDDVREREDWDKLKVALSTKSQGSRVLITTRKKYVAAHVNPCIKPYYLPRLSLEESLKLLRRKVFGDGKCISPPEIREYELHIANISGGIPLAILLIAGNLLMNHNSIHWWERVARSLDFYYSEYEEHDKALMNWSYNHLHYYLKLCFLYLGTFTLGFEILASELLRLWIAENFIPQEEHMELEDVAEGYLEELVCRNLVKVEKRKLNGRVKTCRIYDNFAYFCKQKATEDNVFREIHIGNAYSSSSTDHCICINSNVFDHISEKSFGKNVRSFLAFTEKETTSCQTNMFSILKPLKLLRVLDVRTFNLDHFPSELCQLILLKYIAIRGNFWIFPSKMSSLLKMQTIIVETGLPSIEIKANVWKMTQLRHLYTNAPASFPSPGGKDATNANLQTLSIISPESCREDVFKRTPKLKKLGICGQLALLFEDNGNNESLHQLEFLEKLKLMNTDENRPLRGFPHHRIHRIFPRNLRKLTLLSTFLPWDQMSILGKLEELEVLKLKDNAFEGHLWQTEAGGFFRLKVLHIGRTNLRSLEASPDHVPKLRRLIIKDCTELESMPQFLKDILAH